MKCLLGASWIIGINGLKPVLYPEGESDSTIRQTAIWLNAFLVHLRNGGHQLFMWCTAASAAETNSLKTNKTTVFSEIKWGLTFKMGRETPPPPTWFAPPYFGCKPGKDSKGRRGFFQKISCCLMASSAKYADIEGAEWEVQSHRS